MGTLPLAVGVGGVIVFALARQFIAFRENSRLNDELSHALEKVQQYTSELEEKKAELKVEISERERAEEQLSYGALHDGLTGLPNRVLFMDRLERAIEYTKRRTDYPFSVLFLDIDHFKVINDSLGHAAGDQLLILIAQKLKNRLRASDTIARLGGDEFVILLDNTKEEQDLAYLARCLQEELNTPVSLQGHQVSITASIGIVPGLTGYTSPEEVLQDADIAMYRAKNLGKARFNFFNASLRSHAISRLELENEMRQAVGRGGFQLDYQPIVLLQSGMVIGFEALLRWNHPQRGVLMPADFIYISEESGLIHPIGEWVLYEACSQAKKWNEKYPHSQPLVINVNISGKQFTQPDFIKKIETVLKKTGLAPAALKLEITETALIENNDVAQEVFNQLSAMGVQSQIDDFGTGYSSLGYLQHFPIHTIKIDKTFVEEISFFFLC